MPKAIGQQLTSHKLLFKSRMGKNVEGDMIKFQVGSVYACEGLRAEKLV